MHIRHIAIHLTHTHWTELQEFLAAVTIHSFALKLIDIFLPIFLLNTGLSVRSVALLFIAYYLARIPSHFIFPALINKLRVKHTLTLSFCLRAFGYVLLGFAEAKSSLILPAMMMLGFAEGIFWSAYHADSLLAIKKTKAGRQLSFLFILTYLAMAVAPLVGGVLISSAGYQVTFFIATLLMIAAAIPLVQTPDLRLSSSNNRVGVPRPSKDLVRPIIANFGLNFETGVAGFLWPIFIFLATDSSIALGLIFSLTMTLSLIAVWWSGKLSDRGHSNLLIAAGAIGRGLTHGMRPLAATAVQFFGVNFFGDIVSSTRGVAYSAAYYERARNAGPVKFLVWVEFTATIANMLVWVLVLALSGVFSVLQVLSTMFLIAAAVGPLQGLMAGKPRP